MWGRSWCEELVVEGREEEEEGQKAVGLEVVRDCDQLFDPGLKLS